MKKLLITGALIASFITPFAYIQTAVAAPASEHPALSQEAGRKMPPPRMRRPRLTKEQIVEQLSAEYGYNKAELLTYVNEGTNPRDLGTLCYFARLTGKPLADIVPLRATYTWERLKLAIGLTPQKYYDLTLANQAQKLAKKVNLPAETILKYLKQGYAASDIQMSVLLSENTKENYEQLLHLRTITNTWEKIAGAKGINTDVYEAAVKQAGRLDNSGKRSGAGFAGLHMFNPTKEKLVNILYNDYGFKIDELNKYYDQMSFNDLEALCIYAYNSRNPLEKVAAMRSQYTWEGLKLALGLTPVKYRDRMIEYQADRLAKRMNIDRKITIKYMQMGFPMHHVNTAALYALKCDKDIYEIMLMKTPQNTWNDVALACGLTLQDAKEVKDKITEDFKR